MTRGHGEDKAVYYAALQRRAAALNRLLSIKQPVHPIPTPVVAMHVKTLLMAALGYCGESLRNQWLGWLDEQVRLYAGLCRSCGRQRGEDHEFCETCIREFKEIDLAVDEAEGGVM